MGWEAAILGMSIAVFQTCPSFHLWNVGGNKTLVRFVLTASTDCLVFLPTHQETHLCLPVPGSGQNCLCLWFSEGQSRVLRTMDAFLRLLSVNIHLSGKLVKVTLWRVGEEEGWGYFSFWSLKGSLKALSSNGKRMGTGQDKLESPPEMKTRLAEKYPAPQLSLPLAPQGKAEVFLSWQA